MEQEILFKILIDSVVDRAIFMGGNGMFIRKVKIHNFKCYRDIEIALEAELQPIVEVAKKLDISEEDLDLYGKYKALLPVAHVPVDKKVRVWFQEKLSDANNAAIVKTITSWKKYLTREQYYALQYDARDNASRFDAGSALELEARVMGEWQA